MLAVILSTQVAVKINCVQRMRHYLLRQSCDYNVMRFEVLTALLWNFRVFWCVTLSRWMLFYASKQRSIFILRENQFLRFTLGP